MRSEVKKQLIPYAIVILFAYIGFSIPLPIFPKIPSIRFCQVCLCKHA